MYTNTIAALLTVANRENKSKHLLTNKSILMTTETHIKKCYSAIKKRDRVLLYSTIYMSLENIIMLSELSKAQKINTIQFEINKLSRTADQWRKKSESYQSVGKQERRAPCDAWGSCLER